MKRENMEQSDILTTKTCLKHMLKKKLKYDLLFQKRVKDYFQNYRRHERTVRISIRKFTYNLHSLFTTVLSLIWKAL